MWTGFKIMMITFCFAIVTWHDAYATMAPVSPTDNIFTKVKKPESAAENLPYDVNAHPIDEEDFDEIDNEPSETIETAEESEKEIIDWALVPYVPFKRVELMPAPDPKIE